MENTVKKPAIYADFHGLRQSTRTSCLSAIPLDTYGSLRDLSNQQVRLQEDMQLVVYMDSDRSEDIEADAVTYYDHSLKAWMAEIDEHNIRDVPAHATQNETHFLCFQCRRNLEPYFKEHGYTIATFCPDCGASIMTAIATP